MIRLGGTLLVKLWTRHNLVALICFGPITLVLVPFGLFLLPIWLSILANDVAGNPMGVHYSAGETIWDTVWPITALLLGLLGLVGLFRILSALRSEHADTNKRLLTQLFIASGIVGVVLFNAMVGWINPLEEAAAAMIYWILPLGGTLYFLYVARMTLFRINEIAE
jgi:hypothetical protein